jgi:hypothetical protein
MKFLISDEIRKLASLIERDNTPEDTSIGDHKMLEGGREEQPVEKKKQVVKPKNVDIEETTPTAPSQQRRPRKQPGHKNKWNEETKTGLMKDYITEYRAEGKDKEVDGPKSTYKKKFKV